MKITIDPHTTNQELYWAFLCIVSEPGKRDNFTRALDKRVNEVNEFDIVLTINGEEFNFEKLIARYQNAVEEMVNARAADLLNNRFNTLQTNLNKISESITEAEQNVRRELGLDQEER